MSRPFKSELVVEEKISDATLRAYHVGFDQNQFRLQPLVDILVSVIPEFAFGYHETRSIELTEMWGKLKDAARLIYTTEKIKRRGEFGELVLHFLLRDFCKTIPLISKIYFKDTRNATVKGFDGIHVENNGSKKKLWLGESKIYADGKQGIESLADDLKIHLTGDYLRSEFNLVSKKVPSSYPERDHWIALMHEHQPLDKIFDSICMPMTCTYTSNLFKTHKSNTDKYIDDFKNECETLRKHFEGKKIKTDVEVILMLLPIECKEKLITELDSRLKHAQKI